jgi:hypothetical protein
MTWKNCRLGDVLTLKRGHDLPNDSRMEGDVHVVSSSGITGYHNASKAKAPGVVTGRYGTLGGGILPRAGLLATQHRSLCRGFQRKPPKDILAAQECWSDYKRRKARET